MKYPTPSHLPPASREGRFIPVLKLLGLGTLGLGWVAALPAQGTAPTVLAPYEVKADRVHASEVEGVEAVQTYGADEVDNSGAFTVQEFIDQLPPGTGGNQQLVLVDGLPTMLDLASLPPGMVEAIEVNYQGSMPAYGARAQGRVINIKLKRDYQGRELGARVAGAIAGGGEEREGSVSGGFLKNKFRAFYSLRFSERDAVTAAERDFSRNQDHTARGGRDFRLPWGFPAVVQAAEGDLAGLTADGSPVAVALVPAGVGTPQVPADFLPGVTQPPYAAPVASGQRRFNTSDYLYLVAPSRQLSGNLMLTHPLGPRLNFGLSGSFGHSESQRNGPPPVTPVSQATLVPAALNPFGQDVMVGLVHPGFGPVRQVSRGDNLQLGANLSGRVGESWHWQGALQHRQNRSFRLESDLDEEKFSAALAEVDPLQRFDPFAGEAGTPGNLALYPALVVEREQRSVSEATSVSIQANGDVYAGWGAGPWQLSLGGNFEQRTEERMTRHARVTGDTAENTEAESGAVNASLNLPLVGGTADRDRAGQHRLEAQFSSGLQEGAGGGSERRGAGLLWSPAREWVFRAGLDGTMTSPSEIETDTPIEFAESLSDPRRNPAVADNVQIISRPVAAGAGGESRRISLGVSFEPEWAKGLRLSLGYDDNLRTNGVGPAFRPQELVDNEGQFPGRVLRLPATVGDIALGQPGTIVAVDTTPVPVAVAENQTLDLSVTRRLAETGFGRFNLTASIRHHLFSRYEVVEGQEFVAQTTGPAAQPDWTAQGNLNWQGRGWSVASNWRYTGGVERAGLPANLDLDLSVGYRFRAPLVGDFGKGLHLRGGLRNVLNREPPEADTLLGYRGGSALGQVLYLSARWPM